MKQRKERSWAAALGYRPKSLELFSGKMTPADLGKDVMAGLTVGMIALPLALALGIASVPAGQATPFPAPALGIFTAIIAGFLISALGGSRVQIGGPTAAFIPIILLVIEQHGYAGLLMATVMAGVILIVMGLAKMGSLIKYIPWPVTSGFTTGIAVAIIATQTGDFLGIHTDQAAPREFLERLHWLGRHIADMHVPSVLLAAGCLLVIMFWPRLGFRKVPGSIVAMLGATALVAVFGLQENLGISTIGSKFGSGAIPAGLPAVSWPHFDWAMMRDLIGPATAIALLGAIESLLIRRGRGRPDRRAARQQQRTGGAGHRQHRLPVLRRAARHRRDRADLRQRQQRRAHAAGGHGARAHAVGDRPVVRQMGGLCADGSDVRGAGVRRAAHGRVA